MTWSCADSQNWRHHCWHYPRGFSTRYPRPHEPPWVVTCCDCGQEAEVHTLNRDRHGAHAKGPRFEVRQHRLSPRMRVLRGRDG